MLSRIFPRQADNAGYGGFRAAIWLAVPILVIRAGIGINSMWHPRHVAITADAIPLDTYDPAGAMAVTALFALLGMWVMLQVALGTVVLLRYRALLPLFYLLLLAQAAGNKILGALYPIAGGGAMQVGGLPVGQLVTYAVQGAMLLGLVLSLLPRKAVP